MTVVLNLLKTPRKQKHKFQVCCLFSCDYCDGGGGGFLLLATNENWSIFFKGVASLLCLPIRCWTSDLLTP